MSLSYVDSDARATAIMLDNNGDRWTLARVIDPTDPEDAWRAYPEPGSPMWSAGLICQCAPTLLDLRNSVISWGIGGAL